MPRQQWLYPFLWAMLLAAMVFAANQFFTSSIKNSAPGDPFISNMYSFSLELAGEKFKAPEVWIHEWFFKQEAPFKYRFLAKLPIYASYQLLMGFGLEQLPALYGAYMFWLFVFLLAFLILASLLVTSIVRRFYLPSEAPDPQRLFMVSALCLSLSAPVLWAFKFPVHGSPNDFLGYCFIAAALLALMHQRFNAFIVLTAISVFCRETNLVVLAPFMLMQALRMPQRVLSAGVLIGIYLLFRWQMGAGEYDPTEGAAHNRRFPAETISFLFLAFGPFWVLGVAGFIERWRARDTDDFLKALHRSFIPATLLVLVIVFLFARIREIRIEFILFFYFLPYGIYFMLQQGKQCLQSFRHPAGWLALLITGLIVFRMSLFFTPINAAHDQHLYQSFAHLYGGFGHGWITIFIAYVAVTTWLAATLLLLRVLPIKQRA